MKTKLRLLTEGDNHCEDLEWNDLCYTITKYMNKVNPDSYWIARVENFGWANRNGSMAKFHASRADILLSKILPDCECSFKVYKYGKYGLAINNAHHDKPCGGEWYYILKAKGGESKIRDDERDNCEMCGQSITLCKC